MQVIGQLWIVCLAGALLACGGADDAASESAAEEEGGGQAARAERIAAYDPEEPLGGVSANPEVSALVAGIVANCTVDEKRSVVTKCANDELASAEKWFRENKPLNTAETLTELALTADPQVAAAAEAPGIMVPREWSGERQQEWCRG